MFQLKLRLLQLRQQGGHGGVFALHHRVQRITRLNHLCLSRADAGFIGFPRLQTGINHLIGEGALGMALPIAGILPPRLVALGHRTAQLGLRLA